MTSLDPRQSVEFEPVALGRRRRRIDPLAIAVTVVVVAVLMAVVKPWAAAVPDAPPAAAVADPETSTPVRAGPIDDARPIPAVSFVRAPSLAWRDIAGVIEPHASWGIRVIVRTTSGTMAGAAATYTERWTALTVDPGATRRLILQPGADPVVALGITAPYGQAPLDVRIWRQGTGRSMTWLDAQAISNVPDRGGEVFVPPWTDPGSPTWGPGLYRFDVLTGTGTIQRLEAAIPDRYENIRISSVVPIRPSELVASTEVDPRSVPVGPFATIDRTGVPLESVGGPVLDDVAAWLDTQPGSGKAAVDRVAVAYLPRATGLGVRLRNGSTVRAATFQRLSPGPLANPPTPLGGGVIDRRDADPWVVFAASRGEAWAPGTYQIHVTWSDAAGLHDAAWYVELRPGPEAATPPLLALTRAWARYAGRTGFVVGRAEPLEGGPRSSAIRLLPMVPGTDIDAWCPGTILTGGPTAVGIAHPVDDVPIVGDLFEGSAVGALPTVVVSEAVPGLTLVAPAAGGSLDPGIYRLSTVDRTGVHRLVFCVGDAQAVRG